MLKNNYHTHTYRCHHAIGNEEEYVLEAINASMETLGISDHVPFYKDMPSFMRMDLKEMDDYLNTLAYLKEKYKNKINIKIGFEAEYVDDEIPFYHQLLEHPLVEYLILGNHLFKDYDHSSQRIASYQDLEDYSARAINGMASGLFKYLAHPDLFMVNIKEFDDHCKEVTHRICDAALALDIPLEYNCEGLRNSLNHKIFNNGTNLAYPHPEFWKIVAQKGNKVIIGADAHQPVALNDHAIEVAIQQTKDLSLNIIEKLDF